MKISVKFRVQCSPACTDDVEIWLIVIMTLVDANKFRIFSTNLYRKISQEKDFGIFPKFSWPQILDDLESAMINVSNGCSIIVSMLDP